MNVPGAYLALKIVGTVCIGGPRVKERVAYFKERGIIHTKF